MLDLLIKNGQVVDGLGGPRTIADVAICGTKIAQVAPRISGPAKRIIDAKGLIVCPGFIDSHSHGELDLLTCPTADNKIMQGITTEINGNCGTSAAPLLGAAEAKVLDQLDDPSLLTWETFGGYLDAIDNLGVSVNVVNLVGHNNLRLAVAGLVSRRVYADELDEMKLLLDQAMQEGAFGMSTGLVFFPGCYSDTHELIEMARVLATYGGIYASHQRGEKDQNVEAEWETYSIGEYANVRVHSSHQTLKMGMFGRSGEFIGLMREANNRGVTWTADLDTGELYWCDTGAGLFKFEHEPRQPTHEEKAAMLRDPVTRRHLERRLANDWPPGQGRFGPFKNRDYDRMRVVQSKDPQYLHRTIREVACLRSEADPWDTLCNLYLEQGEFFVYSTQPNDDQDTKEMLLSPFVSISTDAGDTKARDDGPHVGNCRPFSTFPRLFQKFVRGEDDPQMEWLGKPERIISLEALVHKMTRVPAMQFMLYDRGLVAPGACADLVLFDEQRIGTRASVYDTDVYPTGIPYVIVNGQVTKEDGEHTGARAGQVLRWNRPSATDIWKNKSYWRGR